MTAFTAMKQALEYFEQGNFPYPTKIATDLRAAIAELEQTQPVAWIYQNANTNHEYLVWKRSPGGRNWRALYTAPPTPAIPAQQEPVAYVCGTYAGRFIVGPVNGVTVLPDGMALYAAPPAPMIPAGWQPIETAPKNGRILISRVGHPWVFTAEWSEHHKHWATGPSPMDFFANPTHWAPLPQPPKE